MRGKEEKSIVREGEGEYRTEEDRRRRKGNRREGRKNRRREEYSIRYNII